MTAVGGPMPQPEGWGPRTARAEMPGARLGPLLAVLLAGVILTLLPLSVHADGPQAQEAREIARSLQCPVCQNSSVADSPSLLATQMREIIAAKLAAGETRESIMAYFIQRYGEGVLLSPPQEGFTAALWWGPPLVLATGTALLLLCLRQWLPKRAADSGQ